MTTKTLLRSTICVFPLLLIAGARAQSMNIDLDIFAGDPSNGNGAPSPAFAGAAGQPGYWNRLRAGSSFPQSIADTSGHTTGIQFSIPIGAGSSGGSNFPINSGDYALLLNDYARVPDLMVFRFTGMRPGQYRIYTYAVDAVGFSFPALVSIAGSSTPTQRVTGPMPGNTFVRGITHSVHELLLSASTFEIEVRNEVIGPPNSSVNGFQIVAVPEPASLTVLSCLFALMARRRRNL